MYFIVLYCQKNTDNLFNIDNFYFLSLIDNFYFLSLVVSFTETLRIISDMCQLHRLYLHDFLHI